MGILQGQLYVRTRTVQVKSGMSIDSHPDSYVLVQTASPYSPGKYVNWNLSFQWRSCTLAMGILQGNLYVRTRTVQVKVWYVPLILIRRATFWCKRLVRTVPGKYVNWNLSFSMEILYISYGNCFKVNCTFRTRTVQFKSGMSIDSHPESCVLVQTASPYSPSEVC